MFRKPPHCAPATVWGLCILTLSVLALFYLYACTRRPHEPVQPLPFSHATHTAANGSAMVKSNLPTGMVLILFSPKRGAFF